MEMGSPSGCLLADIFKSHIGAEVNGIINPTLLYKRFADGTLIFTLSSNCIQAVLERFNSAYTNVSLTCEGEDKIILHFLGVQLKRRMNETLNRSVCRKPIWAGQYILF